MPQAFTRSRQGRQQLGPEIVCALKVLNCEGHSGFAMGHVLHFLSVLEAKRVKNLPRYTSGECMQDRLWWKAHAHMQRVTLKLGCVAGWQQREPENKKWRGLVPACWLSAGTFPPPPPPKGRDTTQAMGGKRSLNGLFNEKATYGF